MKNLNPLIAGLVLLCGCSGDSSDIEDFRDFEKLGVVGGPTPKDHWHVTAEVTAHQLTLVYHNDSEEDFQWIRFSATDANKDHLLYLIHDTDLSDGVFHGGEFHTFEIDLPEELDYPLWFWAGFVTIHEVTVHDCARLEADGTVIECDGPPPPPPPKGSSEVFYLAY